MSARLNDVHPVLACRAVDESLRFYLGLGFRTVFQDSEDAPKYAVIERDGATLHLQWADASQWDPRLDRPAYRFPVTSVDGLFDEWLAANALTSDGNASPWARPAPTPWGTREFHVRDPGANSLQFYELLGR